MSKGRFRTHAVKLKRFWHHGLYVSLDLVEEAAKDCPMKLTIAKDGEWIWSWDTEHGIIYEVQKWFVTWFGTSPPNPKKPLTDEEKWKLVEKYGEDVTDLFFPPKNEVERRRKRSKE